MGGRLERLGGAETFGGILQHSVPNGNLFLVDGAIQSFSGFNKPRAITSLWISEVPS